MLGMRFFSPLLLLSSVARPLGRTLVLPLPCFLFARIALELPYAFQSSILSGVATTNHETSNKIINKQKTLMVGLFKDSHSRSL